MKKLITIIALVLSLTIIYGCSFNNEPIDDLGPSEDTYTILIAGLNVSSNITKSTITSFLSDYNASTDYTYVFYSGAGTFDPEIYTCHTFEWVSYKAHNVTTIKIWVKESGYLIESLCTYSSY
jgi:hypothetical protein